MEMSRVEGPDGRRTIIIMDLQTGEKPDKRRSNVFFDSRLLRSYR